MPALYLHNSLLGKKMLFTPQNNEHVTLYVCGPTVYSFAHIGNARSSVVFDLFFRLLQRLYPKVTYVRNLTDVDDKINRAAFEEGVSIQAITNRYIQAFQTDMHSLHCLSPTVEPKVTDHIPLIIQKIQQLVESRHAYVESGHVLFHVKRYADYGKLSNRSMDEMKIGARIEAAPYKKDPLDFVLWKPSVDEKTPGWESPWGIGRPGWHIECTALSNYFLGDSFDLHGGGHDLVFPHHENELAQGSCLGGKYARFWLHNGSLQIEGQKMSKSLGNIVLVKDLIKRYHPEVIRLSMLNAHYRQPLNWNEALVAQSKNILDKLYRALKNHQNIETERINDQDFLNVLQDDLNTPSAMMYLQRWLGQLNGTNNVADQKNLLGKIRQAGDLLGIMQDTPDNYLQAGSVITESEINTLIKQRDQARRSKDFKKADKIRDDLLKKGIVLEDHNHQTSWYNQG